MRNLVRARRHSAQTSAGCRSLQGRARCCSRRTHISRSCVHILTSTLYSNFKLSKHFTWVHVPGHFFNSRWHTITELPLATTNLSRCTVTYASCGKIGITWTLLVSIKLKRCLNPNGVQLLYPVICTIPGRESAHHDHSRTLQCPSLYLCCRCPLHISLAA